MSNSLQEVFSASKERLLTEAKKKGLNYEYKAAKHGKILPMGDSEATRVEVLLNNKDIPGKLADVATDAATAVKKLNKTIGDATDSLVKEREVLRGLFEELFAEGDQAITRVIKTASVAIVCSKAGTRSKFDDKQFIELLKANFKDSTKVIESLIKKCTTITDAAGSISVELNESQVNEAVLPKILGKLAALIKDIVKDGIAAIKSIFKDIDARLKKLNSFMTPEEKAEVAKLEGKFNLVNESAIFEDTLKYDEEALKNAFYNAQNSPIINKETSELLEQLDKIDTKYSQEIELCDIVRTLANGTFETFKRLVNL